MSRVVKLFYSTPSEWTKDLIICQVTESIPYAVGNGEAHKVFKQEGEKPIKFLFQEDHFRGRVKTGPEGRWENGRDHLGWNPSLIRGKEQRRGEVSGSLREAGLSDYTGCDRVKGKVKDTSHGFQFRKSASEDINLGNSRTGSMILHFVLEMLRLKHLRKQVKVPSRKPAIQVWTGGKRSGLEYVNYYPEPRIFSLQTQSYPRYNFIEFLRQLSKADQFHLFSVVKIPHNC